MKKTVALLIIFLMTAGFEWGYALSPGKATARQTVPSASDTLFRAAITTVDFQGLKVQNRAQTVSHSRADRQKGSSEAAYTLSADAGIRVGKDGQPAYYQSPPVRLKRNLSTDLLSSGQPSRALDRWVEIINRTLTGLAHKHMTSGEWEEVVKLDLGAGFPESIPARFRAAPLPEPESRWVLITVETGLLSFVPLDRRYEEAAVLGRYRGILVYSPADDAFRQSGGVFDAYRGEDRCRVENLQFATDAEGTQLYPALDAREFLGLTVEPLPIAVQGAFPSWCSQCSLVFDILNAAMMTAAEGSTNWPGVADVEQSLINILNQVNRDVSVWLKTLGQAAADELFGQWMMAIRFASSLEASGLKSALLDLALEVGEDLALIALAASGYGLPVLAYKVAKIEIAFGKEIVKEMARQAGTAWAAAVRSLQGPPRARIIAARPAPPPVRVEESPKPESKPGESKPAKPPKKPGSALKIVGMVLGAAAGIVGGLYLGKLIQGGSTDEGGGGGSGGFPISVENRSSYVITSFVINGKEYGPIAAGAEKSFSIEKTGSCTTVNCSWKTAELPTGNGSSGRYGDRFGLQFTNNPTYPWGSVDPIICAFPVSNC